MAAKTNKTRRATEDGVNLPLVRSSALPFKIEGPLPSVTQAKLKLLKIQNDFMPAVYYTT